ncbi:hypothetical protein ISS42_02990, partial [Candidatus Shapirobacteria bacterium]|nr:hypothetical protein [Candidatus Shapirobacteria bacterium]
MRKVFRIFLFILALLCFFPLPVLAADYTVFYRHPFSSNYILPGTEPDVVIGDRILSASRGLELFASRGEYESTTLAIYNPVDGQLLDNVRVSVDKLTSGVNRIGPDKIDIRVIKVLDVRRTYNKLSDGLYESPEVLIPYTADYLTAGEFDLPAGKTKQWWLTVKIDQSTPAGTYQGAVKIKPANADLKTIPIK